MNRGPLIIPLCEHMDLERDLGQFADVFKASPGTACVTCSAPLIRNGKELRIESYYPGMVYSCSTACLTVWLNRNGVWVPRPGRGS